MALLTTINAESWYEHPGQPHGTLSLVPVMPVDIGRLENWLAASHLERTWLPHGGSLEARISAARSDCVSAMEEAWRAPFMIRRNGDRIGYLELVHANDALVLKELGFVVETVAIRLFIGGAADLGKGYGRRALRIAAEATLGAPSIQLIVGLPSPRQRAAVRCFSAAGFEEGRVMITPLGPSVQMLLSRALSGASLALGSSP